MEALKKILKTKSPAAQVIQELLEATRNHRQKWLSSTLVSAHDILAKYPVFSTCIIQHIMARATTLVSQAIAGLKFDKPTLVSTKSLMGTSKTIYFV